MLVLVGDIGGTKSHFALYRDRECLEEQIYSSKNYNNFSNLFSDFYQRFSEQVDCVCLGVAGPVLEGRCQVTHLPWYLDEKEIAAEFKIPRVFLMNDLEAYGHGISKLGAEDLVVLHENEAKGNQVVIAAGTGLGELGLYWDGKAHHVVPTGGGHADFAPRDEREIELLMYLKSKYEHVSYEKVLSGPGLSHLFLFYIEYKKEEKPDWLDQVVLSELPAMISKKGLANECRLSRKVMEWFVSLYGAEAGNLALKYLSVGGVYVAGAIAQKNIELIKEGFLEAFRKKGHFESLLTQMSVKVIMNERTPLLGALAFIEKKFQVPYGREYVV